MTIIGKEKAITCLVIVAAVAVVLIVGAGIGHPIQPYYSYAQPATPFSTEHRQFVPRV